MPDYTNYATLAQSIPDYSQVISKPRKYQTDVDFNVTGNINEYAVFGIIQFTANITQDTDEYYDIVITDRSQLKTICMLEGNEVGLSNHLVTDEQITAVIERIQHKLVIEECE